MTTYDRLIDLIAACSDPAKLHNWIGNAEREGAPEVAEAARRRLAEVAPGHGSDLPGDDLVQDFWKSILTHELFLSEDRGAPSRLTATRARIAEVGVHQTLTDIALGSEPSEGYRLLRERGMLDLSAEAVVLRFPGRFQEDVVEAARARLMRGRPLDG